MHAGNIIIVILTSLALAGYSGCGGTDQAAAIVRNASDAEIVVERIDRGGADGYVLTGTIAKVTAAGGSAAIAESGQKLSLTPFFPGGRPDPGNPAHSRLMMLQNIPPGSTIRCRIALEAGVGWRIISVD